MFNVWLLTVGKEKEKKEGSSALHHRLLFSAEWRQRASQTTVAARAASLCFLLINSPLAFWTKPYKKKKTQKTGMHLEISIQSDGHDLSGDYQSKLWSADAQITALQRACVTRSSTRKPRLGQKLEMSRLFFFFEIPVPM